MLAKLAESLPDDGTFLFEPKWDGFRAIVFRGAADVYIQSRDLKPLDRYFPELHDSLLERLPKGSVIDGEIVIATAHGLDFDALQMRLHPAASRVAKLAKETPSSFVAFDLLASELGRLHPEPRPEAAGPLFPGIARLAARAAAERQCDRRRDRDRHGARSRLRRAPDAAASRRLARGEAREGDALELCGIRPPRL